VSYEVLVSHPILRTTFRPLRTQAGVEQWVDVTLNGAAVTRAALDTATTVSATMAAPFRKAEPNVITFEFHYRRHADALGPAHRLNGSGLTVPVDAVVGSAGQPHGDAASIRVGIGELAPNRRGYNLVAIRPSRSIEAAVAFDTCGDPTASAALATWVADLPAGSIVLGAVRDEASSQLGADAIQALATLGVRGDLRGRYRESHAFIGVKGAPPATALEAIGPRAVEVRIGDPGAGFGLELLAFQLDAAPHAP
jgi:hypothetical protein